MNEKVLVTGSTGMIGSRVFGLLPCYLFRPISLPRDACDLTNTKRTIEIFCDIKPDYIINCAGWNGGIGFNRSFPAEVYWTNAMISMNVLRASLFAKVKKVVSTITSCAYPERGSGGNNGLYEYDLWNGKPADSVSCHGYARRTLDAYGKQLFKQHGLMAVNVIFNNCYGPQDRFDPERSKFMAALIKKFADAKRDGKPEVILWGTGDAKRELLYRDDAARALIHALKEYDDPICPLNMGSGKDYKIKKYAKMVAKATDFQGDIIWDSTKPDGQMRKLLCVKRMSQHTTFRPEMLLEEGIRRTVKWYNENYDTITK